MTDRILPLLALLLLVGFFAVLLLKLQRIDLTVLVIVTVGLAAWDIARPPR